MDKTQPCKTRGDHRPNARLNEAPINQEDTWSMDSLEHLQDTYIHIYIYNYIWMAWMVPNYEGFLQIGT